MQEIKISVIMGVFNPKDEKQFYKAVNSILEQTFCDLEFIIYNDGSDDIYEDLFGKICKLDNRIVYLKSKCNAGLANALNQCIAVAKGNYLARMDADDVALPNRLKRLYDFLEENQEYQWVGSNAKLMSEQGVWGSEAVPVIPVNTDFLRYSPYIHPAVMFRKSVLKAVKGYNKARVTKRCEDYELFMRLHYRGYQGYNIQEDLLLYSEDVYAYKKRKYRYCIQEMCVRYLGFKKLGILKMKTIPYVIKPLLVGLMPAKLRFYIKQRADHYE